MLSVIKQTLERMGLREATEEDCGAEEEKDEFHKALYGAEVVIARAEGRHPRSWDDLMVPRRMDRDHP
jgi:hypothetical protein